MGSRVRIRRAIVLVNLAVVSAALVAPKSAVAVRSEFFGISQGPPISDGDLGGIQRARIRTMRYLFSWASVQPKPCCFNWGGQDRLMGRLVAHGIRVVPALWGSPSWAESYPARPPIDKLPAWQTFLRRFVRHYGPGGSYWPRFRARYPGKTPLPVQAYQIWNEPNLKNYWIPYPAPTRYGKLLKASSTAIKGEYPKAKIVLGGMPGYGNINAWDFLDQLYERGSKAILRRRRSAPVRADRGQDRDGDPEVPRRDDEPRRRRYRNLGHGDRLGLGPGHRRPSQQGAPGPGDDAQRDLQDGVGQSRRVERAAALLVPLADPLESHATGCTFCATAGLLKHNYTPKPALSVFKSFTAETTPPVAAIISGPSEGTAIHNPMPTFGFTSSEPGSTFECRLDWAPFRLQPSVDHPPPR